MNFTRTLAGDLRKAVNRRRRHGRWKFLRGFFKNPVMVGSVVPSSRILIDKMLEPVDWQTCRLFIEYGPGVGTFTREILDRLHPDARLIAIDTNEDFIAHLKEEIDDPRLIAVHGSAANVEEIVADHGFDMADYVVSGLPFSTLPPGLGDTIGRATANVIAPGGAFLVYQFSPKVRQFLQPHFDRIDSGFEWRNIPPATLFWAWRS